MQGKAFFRGKELVVFDSVYAPSEDSFFLAENVIAGPEEQALDMGCGSGIQSISLALQGANVTAVDINPRAVENTAENAERLGLSDWINAVQSDLFSALKGKKFGLIVFNPPYLPAEGKPDAALDGGKQGNELILEFLGGLPEHLSANGECFFIASSVSGTKDLEKKIRSMKLNFSIHDRKHLFLEELLLFRVFR